ncbi:heterogeneous nuclear ribonucleoprotein L isoform X15 [Drosophila kikkawai]|uniref:Heterogeneous nuclear ribonucleoprotein L isoform X15 n=1 Tax=Drosophila kikkawai TaxID=30033 RepID=A0A6P4I878_DROKI|nr:heterogeneous nuclear ribonucleoprotein L isoform X12 [Drosophila kikkawai]
MNNLNANASAFMWHNPSSLQTQAAVQQQQQQQQQQPVQQQQQQAVQQQQQQAVQQQSVVQHVATGQLLHVPAMPQQRKFGNKSNYNYVQSQAGAMMSPGTPGAGGGSPMGSFGSSPGLYRKRFPINAYNTGCYQTNEPPLLGPGAAFPPFGAPEYHTTTPENWKGAAIHPTGLMKEPAGVVPGRNAPVAFTPQGQAQGAVMMVYGLDHDTSNTDKLFNLVCLYGNVARIKFLKTKEGTAMVQMGDSVAVERCVQHLNNIPVGTGGKIQIAFSKQNFLSEVINPFLLPDHTPSFKEYTGSKNNRFLSPAQASKNRIQPPSKILHFFNTPPGLTEDQLIGIFNIKDVPATSVRLFPLKTERSSSGLIEFPNISQAVLAIMKCNHLPIEGKGTKFPFIMKLCFSSSKSMNGAWNNATSEGMVEKENEVDAKVDIYN